MILKRTLLGVVVTLFVVGCNREPESTSDQVPADFSLVICGYSAVRPGESGGDGGIAYRLDHDGALRAAMGQVTLDTLSAPNPMPIASLTPDQIQDIYAQIRAIDLTLAQPHTDADNGQLRVRMVFQADGTRTEADFRIPVTYADDSRRMEYPDEAYQPIIDLLTNLSRLAFEVEDSKRPVENDQSH